MFYGILVILFFVVDVFVLFETSVSFKLFVARIRRVIRVNKLMFWVCLMLDLLLVSSVCDILRFMSDVLNFVILMLMLVSIGYTFLKKIFKFFVFVMFFCMVVLLCMMCLIVCMVICFIEIVILWMLLWIWLMIIFFVCNILIKVNKVSFSLNERSV